MVKKLQTPCSAPTRGIPWELKYKYAVGGWTSFFKGIMYAIREKYGAAAVLEIFERVWKMGDRVKNMTNSILNVFKLEDNNAETIGAWYDIWGELTGYETTILERSKSIEREKNTKCPWKTEPKDISDWSLIFSNIVVKTINPKATFERLKGMCEGDPDCEFVTKMEA